MMQRQDIAENARAERSDILAGVRGNADDHAVRRRDLKAIEEQIAALRKQVAALEAAVAALTP